MLRYFSIMSFLSIVIAAALLILFYREVAIKNIIDLGERSNLILGQTALNTMKPLLVDYFASVSDISGEKIRAHPIHGELHQAIQDIMQDTTIVRIKLYNQKGSVAFSTKASQIGRDQSDNPGFVSAMAGKVKSRLLYRDTFNVFDKETEDANLNQSYIPVRLNPMAPIQGVFEIYTDVNTLVKRTEHTVLVIMVGVAPILTLLYSFLLFIVRRAERIIERQQSTIRDRTRTLELLSAQMLTAQENEKKRIAGDLHEGIAQTLSAVKAHVEAACLRIEQCASSEDATPLEAVVPIIQDAIQEVRAFAMALRPAGLEEFGIVSTLSWLCREFQSIYRGLCVEIQMNIQEQEIPGPLKIIIYRIVQEALTSIGKNGQADRMHLDLSKIDSNVILMIEDNAMAYHPVGTLPQEDTTREIGLATMKERTVLSGGTFSVDSNHRGGTISRASWPC